MAEIGSVLTRLAELAEQSANGVFSNVQRSNLQLEFTALTAEIERIAVTTEFNGVNLLSGTSTTVFQVGFDGQETSRISFSSTQATLESLGLAAPGGFYTNLFIACWNSRSIAGSFTSSA
jgi:flagellin